MQLDQKRNKESDLMSVLDDGDDYNSISKNATEVIKKTENSLVFKDGEKIIKISKINDERKTEVFELILRKAIVDEFCEMGLDWSISAFSNENGLYVVEKRPPLKVVSDSDFSKQEVLKKNSEFVKRIEKRLEFPRIVAQVAMHMKTEVMSLQRDVAFEFSDFAILGGNIVPLGNSNYFITFLHYDGSWNYEASSKIIRVTTSRGDFHLSRMKLFKPGSIAIEKTHESSWKWWLFDDSNGDVETAQEELINESLAMFETNLQIVTKKELRDVKTLDDYFSMTKECERRGLVGVEPRKSLVETGEMNVA